ncbi:MAG TPA: thiamine ABC transporter substrate binding subunit [Devosia sp.]|nr:thiamine ABC transporter substrate binding subunit [Devosiaceae bacterium]HVY52235.1 thiamine ABC transporter substrate binding subunit [Devosia sp.]
MPRYALLALAAFLTLAAPAAAEDKPTLTIYTYDAFAADYGPGPGLKAGFEKTCGCTVNFVGTDSSIGALRRVQLEGASSKADIVLGLDTSLSGEARATGLFAPHGLTPAHLTLPSAWTDPDFVPVDFGYFAFVYDTNRVHTPPTSFEALAAEPPSFKIALEDPRSDTPGLGLVLWIKAAYGDKAPAIWAALKPHIVTMARSWSDAYGLFLKGDADMALSYTTSPAYHEIAENKPNYAYATFSEGHYPQIEIAGLLKSSPHAELARQFLAWLDTQPAQAIIPTTNWMYPAADIGGALPKQFPAPPQKVLGLDEGTITENKSAWIEEALAAIR